MGTVDAPVETPVHSGGATGYNVRLTGIGTERERHANGEEPQEASRADPDALLAAGDGCVQRHAP
ncbi:hypothetical protein J1614_012182 [Plenodomus biglobosus]|nr:hypothetical protein J1614_012182 [Plenodomus biglobosus]